jgi:hypothetical protein
VWGRFVLADNNIGLSQAQGEQAMSNNTNTAAATVTTVDVLGLAAEVAHLEAEASKSAKQRKRTQARAEKQLAAKRAWALALAKGTHKSASGKTQHNPQLRPDTVRKAEPGETVGGKPAKGWVVEIACQTCKKTRLVNTQDAFQVQYCSASCKPKGSSKSRVAERTAELSQMSEEELRAKMAELQARVAG